MKNWFGKQWNWIKSFLSESPDGNGMVKGSSKRLAAVAVTFTFVYVTLGEYSSKGVIPEIPDGWLWVLGIVLGVTGMGDLAKNYLSKKNVTDKAKS